MKSIKVYFNTKTKDEANEVFIIMNIAREDLSLKDIKKQAQCLELKGNKVYTIFHNLIKAHEVINDINEKALNSKILSTRQRECLSLAAKGLSTRESGEILHVSSTTIRTHLENAYKKLEVSNKAEAITACIKEGLIDV